MIHGCECAAGGDAPGAHGDDGENEPQQNGGGGGADEDDAGAPVRNFVTVVPTPWRVPAATASCATATHFRRERSV